MENINKIYRIPISIDANIIQNIKSFFNDTLNELETIEIKHEYIVNDYQYTIILDFNFIIFQQYQKIGVIDISIYKKNEMIFSDTMSIFSISDLFRIVRIEYKQELFLLKLVENIENRLLIFKETFENLIIRKSLTKKAIKNLILYNSFNDKMEGMAICFALLFDGDLIVNDLDIQKLLIDKLNNLGYDEYILKMKRVKNDTSYNAYLNTLILIIKILYKQKTLSHNEGRKIALRKINLFKDLLENENYFQVI